MARKRYTRPVDNKPWSAGKKAGAVFAALISILGLIILITSDSGEGKLIGGIMMIGPIALAMGLSSGTGRPYGGKRYKGLGGY